MEINILYFFRMDYSEVRSSLFDIIDEKRFPKMNDEERIATHFEKVLFNI